MAAPFSELTRPLLHGIIDACPEAFAAVDDDFLVVEWNPAAEALTGFRREDVIGGPLPHLTPAQRDELRENMPAFDRWRKEVPVVLPRRHADGRSIQVCVTAYMRLVDEEGSTVGFGSFFRAVRVSDPRTHIRNVYSRMLAQAVRHDDVVESLRLAVVDLLRRDEAVLLVRQGGAWRGALAVGTSHDVAEAIAEQQPGSLDAVAEGRGAGVVALVNAGEVRQATVVTTGAGPTTTALALLGGRDPQGWDLTDPGFVELAEAIAAEAWGALTRVDAVAELEDKVEILQAIAGVASATALDYDSMVNHIARHAASALSCERAAVYVWDDRRGELALEAFHSADRVWGPGDPIHVDGRHAAAEMLASVEPFLTQDARSCPWLSGPWDPREGAVSVYGMPLAVGGRDLGLLVVAHTTANPRGFTTLCTQVGSALSGQAALAISSSRLLAEQAEANRQLHEGNRRRADYVEGITHDLRTPITAVLGFAKTLQRAGDRLTPGDREEALATIERQALRVNRMLDDMMDSARADAGELRPDRLVAVPLHHIVSEAFLTASPEQRNRLRAVADPAVVAYGDADQLTRVVQNLVGNALRYAPGHTPVEVHVREEDGRALLVVVDHGPGIPPGVEVFGKFTRGDSRGTGLGLYTVKTIVEAHDGTIDLRATEGGGTSVEVRLPLFSET